MMTQLAIGASLVGALLLVSLFALGILNTLFMILCALLVFIVFLQKGKGSLGLGSMGGATQMLFGGSGGQTLFQKATWVLVVIFMVSSLVLSIQKTRSSKHVSRAPISLP